jgi:hypothetical protein
LREFVGLQSTAKHFKNKCLPTNYPGGHQEYLQKWLYLFLYETFNILVNAKRSNAKEEEFADQQNKMNRGGFKRGGKVLSSPGFSVTGSRNGEFTAVRLYEEPPHASEDASKVVQKLSRDGSFFFKQCRDDDLLLISADKIDLQGKDDIKQVGGAEFLLK